MELSPYLLGHQGDLDLVQQWRQGAQRGGPLCRRLGPRDALGHQLAPGQVRAVDAQHRGDGGTECMTEDGGSQRTVASVPAGGWWPYHREPSGVRVSRPQRCLVSITKTLEGPMARWSALAWDPRMARSCSIAPPFFTCAGG
jgi:hypothetical protein